MRRIDISGRKGVQPAAVSPKGFGPADLRDAYGLTADGADRAPTIAIVDAMDGPTAEADLAVYRAQFGLPACTTDNGCFRKVDQRGGTDYPTPDPGWAQEISLDLDMVSAICPGCHILLVEADSAYLDDLGAGVTTAVAMGAKYVSNSYGSSYSPTPGSGENEQELHWDAYYDHAGVVVTASTGDSGYGVSYPAASQYVTAVGGTSLSQDPGVARGWAEQVWRGAGSGCSTVEPKPSFQTDNYCPMRAVADVSAVADPYTGVAVYDSYQVAGWGVFGGTSASAPIIAATYALAGEPVSGTYPNSYPYLKRGELNDVTVGENTSYGCDPAPLCTATAGYDGPTGLGTPNGSGAFAFGPHGTLTGMVTDTATGAPLADVSVSLGAAGNAHTGADGTYRLALPKGHYDFTISKYGYIQQSGTADLADDVTLTQNFALTAAATVTVHGTVHDGSGHGWPLRAKVAVKDVPGAPVLTDPTTGEFTVELPGSATYTVRVEVPGGGYQAMERTIDLTSDEEQQLDLAVPADWQESCATPGYQQQLAAEPEHFEGGGLPDGWSQTSTDPDITWRFDDPDGEGNHTGGSAGFARAGATAHNGNWTDDLVTPLHDLSGVSQPMVSFDTSIHNSAQEVFERVYLSTDGGHDWDIIWSLVGALDRDNWHVQIPIPQAAGQKSVRLAFQQYTPGRTDGMWQVDDVALGQLTCQPVVGGLVSGHTTSTRTGAALTGVRVGADGGPTAVSADHSDDPDLGGGYFQVFVPGSGPSTLSAELARYQTARIDVSVVADQLVQTDIGLGSAHLVTSEGTVTVTALLGTSVSRQVVVRNDGDMPAQLDVRSDRRGQTPLTAPQWERLADYPVSANNNALVTDPTTGRIYSVGGTRNGGTVLTAAGYVFDPIDGRWSPIPALPTPIDLAAYGFVGGKLIVAGGEKSVVAEPETATLIFDPAADTWTTGSPLPKGTMAAGSAVLDDQLYVVGGCQGGSCVGAATHDVYRYDPDAAGWTQLADYPEREAFLACGGVDEVVVCAGGSYDRTTSVVTSHAYAYNPISDRWTRVADLPVGVARAQSASANGQLVVTGGRVDGSPSGAYSDQAVGFAPRTGRWTSLPDLPFELGIGAGTCGLYVMGQRRTSPSYDFYTPTAFLRLTGYDQCTDQPRWLTTSTSRLEIPAGGSATVTLTLDAAAVEQPGTYTADLVLSSDTPYELAPVPVTFTVDPPASWGRLTGVVTGRSCDGTTAPIRGAGVDLSASSAAMSGTTDKDGRYVFWLDRRNNPVTLIVGSDGWVSQLRTVRVKAGQTTTADFVLTPASGCR